MLSMMLDRLKIVVCGVRYMAVRSVSMVGCLFVITTLVVLSGLAMMMCRAFVVLCCGAGVRSLCLSRDSLGWNTLSMCSRSSILKTQVGLDGSAGSAFTPHPDMVTCAGVGPAYGASRYGT
jgi:hypothetical protein